MRYFELHRRNLVTGKWRFVMTYRPNYTRQMVRRPFLWFFTRSVKEITNRDSAEAEARSLAIVEAIKIYHPLPGHPSCVQVEEVVRSNHRESRRVIWKNNKFCRRDAD